MRRFHRIFAASVGGGLGFAVGNVWPIDSYAVIFLTSRRWLQRVAAASVVAFDGYCCGCVILQVRS